MPQRESLIDLMRKASLVMLENPICSDYDERHGISSAPILTVCDDEIAAGLAELLAPRLTGKVVVEIGGGIGLLACHIARYAKRVFCFEANPVWAESFAHLMFENKPKNLSYLFGSAEEFVGQISGDVALFASHSGIKGMEAAGLLLAPLVIDIYGELIAGNPAAFDTTASFLRRMI